MARGSENERLAAQYLNKYAEERKDSGVTEFFVVKDGKVTRQNSYSNEEYRLLLKWIEIDLNKKTNTERE